MYFRKYDENAHLASKQRAIQEATEVLYNIQVAEDQIKTSRRQWVLSLVVGLLTSLTLISVTSDGYNFVREERALMDQPSRLALLGLELVLILVILLALSVMAARARRRRVVDAP